MAEIPDTLEALRVPISTLKPHGRNPRRGDVKEIVRSLKRHGQYRPIVVNARTQEVLAGNHTLKAAQELGWDEIAATFVDVDEDTAARIVLIDNRTNDLAGYDDQALAELLKSLPDLEGTGYAPIDLEGLLTSLGQKGRAGEDTQPGEPPKKPKTQPGDVYVLGEHRLICGDSSSLEVIDRLRAGELAEMVLGDPPYNVTYTGGSTNAKAREDSYADDFEDYSAWLEQILANAHVASDREAALHLWFGTSEIRAVLAALDGAGWQDRSLIIWNKLNAHYGALGAQYKHRYEPLFYAHKSGESPRWFGATNEASVWDHDQPSVNDLHPTMKPIGLYERSLANHTAPGMVVLELFGGSGTTLIAAENLDRTAYVVESEPRFCDVIVDRWERHTGGEAELIRDADRQAA